MARASGPRAAALLVVMLLSLGSALSLGLEPSSNMTDPCYTTPSAPTCAAFQRADAEWTSDLQALCKAMPFMVGCSMWTQCTNGQAKAASPYCALPSLVANICGPDDMGKMKGCEAHDALCGAGTVVQQCLANPAMPGVLTTFQTKGDIDGVCTTHSMDGCQECTSVGQTNFKSCPEVFDIYSRLCVSMPDMETCDHWRQLCANQDAAAAFPKFCTQDAADSSSSSLPPMKMWFHQSTRDIFLFKEWVPTSTGMYVGLCIAMCAVAVATQFLKAVRLRVEMRWSAQGRMLACLCDDDMEKACGGGGGGSATPKPHGSSDALANGSSKPPCCAGGAGSSDEGLAVPVSSRRKYWLSAEQGTLVAGGYQLITREQALKNFYRACFTFVVIFLDYALMLVVMTFNVGIILAVCGGFAIGALLFGHAGEASTLQRRGSRAAVVAPGGGQGRAPTPLSTSSTAAELETVFVEGGGCCGGSGYGGGGHCGGQL